MPIITPVTAYDCAWGTTMDRRTRERLDAIDPEKRARIEAMLAKSRTPEARAFYPVRDPGTPPRRRSSGAN